MNALLNKKYSKLIYSIIINLFVFIFFQLINQIHYDISDDMYIALFIKTGDWYFGFASYFFCAFCGLIQNIIYPLNAYTFVLEFLLILSMISITNVFIKRFGYGFGTIVVLLFEAFFAVNFYSNVSFTKSPAIICMAGFIVILDSIKSRFYGLKIVYGSLLVIIGSSIRFQIFEVTAAFVLVFILVSELQKAKRIDKTEKKFKYILKKVFEPKRTIALISVFLVAFTLNYVSGKIITSTEDLKYFRAYTAARAAVWDYPIPEYEMCPEEYDAIGIDKNDLEMLRFGYMDDEGAFSLDNLRVIKDLANKHIKSKRSITEILYETVRTVALNIKNFNEEGLAYLAFVLFAVLYILINKKNKFALPIVLLLTAGFFYLYLHYIDRYPYRAVFVIWVSGVLLLMYGINVDDIGFIISRTLSNTLKSIVASFLVLSVLLSGLFVSLKLNVYYSSYVQTDLDKDAKLKDFIYSNNAKYELPRFMGELSMTYNNVVLSVDVSADKYLKFMGTYYQSTYYKKQISEFKTNNMFSNLLNKNIYYVDKNGNDTQVEIMCKYLNKYYSDDCTINYKLIQDCGNYSIYKFFEK